MGGMVSIRSICPGNSDPEPASQLEFTKWWAALKQGELENLTATRDRDRDRVVEDPEQ